MKKGRITAVVAMLALAGAVGSSAMDSDWGGFFENASTPSIVLDSSDPILRMDQKDRLALWAEMHFSPDLFLAVQGSYTFSLDVPYLFDVDSLVLDWRMLPSLRAALGRFIFSDFTGHVLNHKLDGALFTLDFPFAVVTVGAGFSGFVFKPASQIIMSRSDDADQDDSDVYFAAQRIIEKLDILFPELFARQDLTLSLVMQQDLRDSGSLIGSGETAEFVTDHYGGRLSTQYVGLGLSGPISSSFYYDAFFYMGLGETLSYAEDSGSLTGYSYRYDPIRAFLAGIGIRCYNEGFHSSRAELRFIFSSGDEDNTTFLEGNTAGDSNLFVPISKETLGLAFEPQLGNLIVINANYSLKPVSNLQLMGRVLSFLRPTTGAIYAGGIDRSSDGLYLGTEIDAIANFRPFPDLGGAASLGLFIPNGDAFSGPDASPVLAARLEVSLSF